MNQLFHKRRERLNLFQTLFSRKPTSQESKSIEDKAVTACPTCGMANRDCDVLANLSVCPQCQHHHSMGAYERLEMLLDPKSFYEIYTKASSHKINDFPEYLNKINASKKRSGLSEAVVCGIGSIQNHKVAIAVMDNRFMMGSMGQVVGEKITRLVELADRRQLPLFIFTASGGARMQEGILSLMQMAKTSAALAHFQAKGGFYGSILTHPTTGGVSASFAMLGDVILAEPHATIGFAGRRVIEKTVNEQLPADFQTSEFLLQKGFVDAIISRSKLKQVLIDLIILHGKGD